MRINGRFQGCCVRKNRRCGEFQMKGGNSEQFMSPIRVEENQEKPNVSIPNSPIPIFISQKPHRSACSSHSLALQTFLFANFFALLSFEFLNNSITRLSYGAKPATSRINSRTCLVRLERTYFAIERFEGRAIETSGCAYLGSEM